MFNAPGAFSPHGYVETCSTLAWIQLNRELLASTGEARYAEEIERSAYNDLLAAQAPAGEDWCYYVVPERPPRTHDVLALLQVERRDGAGRTAGTRLRRR